ncbi:MAG: MerR family transcriptional regulator [Bacteroidales bacterium]|nr:MerR family transcriptional regulator [Bacteroidales bacterium]
MKTKNVHDIAQKSYLTIGEVARQLGVSVEVIRKWEREFPRQIRPLRTKGDVRLYNKKDVENIEMIQRLLHNEGMTVAGAQKKLTHNQSREEAQQEVISRLRSIRKQLQDIVEQIDIAMQ